jgi:hypothetical protein
MVAGGELLQETAAPVEPIRVERMPTEDGAREKVTWDLREARKTEKVGWPKEQGNSTVLSVGGDFEFHLMVKDGKDFEGRARIVEARRSGDSVEGVEITGHALSTDDAFGQAKDLMERMGFGAADQATLQAWHAQAKEGNYNNLKIEMKNSYSRKYTVRIVNDGTSEMPWSVGFDVDWTKVCGCQG